MNNNELTQKIYEVSHLEGEFTLRSGQISHEYFDKYLFESHPELLVIIAEKLSEMIPQGTEVLAGLEMGGIPIATALSIRTGIPVVFVRKKAKEYGTCKLAEGIEIRDKNVCIIEDVVTTGGQIKLSANDLRNFGANIKNVICVIERDKKGRENLKNEGLKLLSLFTMEDLKKHL
ncbi:orotate phosphoribosyltransferase [Oceanirhabdus sp. W0125-5]|uniref:orotate phosphoribosyltransferase n=1 Tax=Oceanirhabdus sp. W0125-5 TaxID=2999116 RepID=UPI0022F32A30|nr:orotate phosphoribosyltransferase [Oceanirhabdus sp. W0125-5]WBW95580.1 orotate phosphoribosyltransferase [Oceanirhabdus sp. W0125-5]